MFETRKYFDYKLAYDGYLLAKELFEKGGIQAILDSDEFEISEEITIEDWKHNGYLPLYASGYNVTIYLNDRNFDTNYNGDLYVSGEVEVYSYAGGNDILYINDKATIIKRINDLVNYAKNNEYTLDDIHKEYESLEETAKILTNKEKKMIMKEQIFNKMKDFGWHLENFEDVYDYNNDFIDNCYDYIKECDEELETINMNDISRNGFEDMITFMSDFLRAINEIDELKEEK